MNGHTMDTTQPVRGNEILPCAAMWMDLASTVLSEMSKIETKTVTHHLSVESKQTSSEHGKAETDPQTQGNKLVVTSKEGGGRGKIVIRDQRHKLLCIIWQQGYVVWHRELKSVSYHDF